MRLRYINSLSKLGTYFCQPNEADNVSILGLVCTTMAFLCRRLALCVGTVVTYPATTVVLFHQGYQYYKRNAAPANPPAAKTPSIRPHVSAPPPNRAPPAAPFGHVYPLACATCPPAFVMMASWPQSRSITAELNHDCREIGAEPVVGALAMTFEALAKSLPEGSAVMNTDSAWACWVGTALTKEAQCLSWVREECQADDREERALARDAPYCSMLATCIHIDAGARDPAQTCDD